MLINITVFGVICVMVLSCTEYYILTENILYTAYLSLQNYVDIQSINVLLLLIVLSLDLVLVTSTESATMALSMFQKRNNYYDIVIADIGMPEMGIYEFVEKLRVHHKTVPVICKSVNLLIRNDLYQFNFFLIIIFINIFKI